MFCVEQENSFKKSKEILINSDALVHFDPKLPLVVVADSTAYDSSEITESIPIPSEWHMIVNFLDSSPVTSEHIRKKLIRTLLCPKCSSFVNLGGLHLQVTQILLLMLEERMNSPCRMAVFFGVLVLSYLLTSGLGS